MSLPTVLHLDIRGVHLDTGELGVGLEPLVDLLDAPEDVLAGEAAPGHHHLQEGLVPGPVLLRGVPAVHLHTAKYLQESSVVVLT